MSSLQLLAKQSKTASKSENVKFDDNELNKNLEALKDNLQSLL
jgi:hypothetical protein